MAPETTSIESDIAAPVEMDTPYAAANMLEEASITRSGILAPVAENLTTNYLENIDAERVLRNARALDALEQEISVLAPTVIDYATGERYRSIMAQEPSIQLNEAPLTPEQIELADRDLRGLRGQSPSRRRQ